MLLEKAIDMFIENCKALKRSPKTIDKYKYCLKKFDIYLNNQYNRPINIDEVRPEDMERFLFQQFNPSEYSSSMRHNVVTALRSLYSYLERKKLCINIRKLVKCEKVETGERETVSEMEFRKLMQHIKAQTTRALWVKTMKAIVSA